MRVTALPATPTLLTPRATPFTWTVKSSAAGTECTSSVSPQVSVSTSPFTVAEDSTGTCVSAAPESVVALPEPDHALSPSPSARTCTS